MICSMKWAALIVKLERQIWYLPTDDYILKREKKY